MPFPLGISDSQKKQPPLPPSVVSQSDSGSGRDFDNGANFLTFQGTTFTGKLPIIDYTVTATATDNSDTVSLTVNSVNPFVFTGLKSGKNYRFKIRARNQVYNSSFSSEFGPGLATTVPGRATSAGATNAGNGGGASLSWTAPSNGGKAITSYLITPNIGTPVETGSASTSYTFSGLTVGTGYNFTVAARNENGLGQASTTSNLITITAPVVVPPPPPPQTGGGGCTTQPVTISGASLTALNNSGLYSVSVSGSNINLQPPTNISVGGSNAYNIAYTASSASGQIAGLSAGSVYDIQFFNGCTPLVGSFRVTAPGGGVVPPPPPPIAINCPSIKTFSNLITGGTTLCNDCYYVGNGVDCSVSAYTCDGTTAYICGVTPPPPPPPANTDCSGANCTNLTACQACTSPLSGTSGPNANPDCPSGFSTTYTCWTPGSCSNRYTTTCVPVATPPPPPPVTPPPPTAANCAGPCFGTWRIVGGVCQCQAATPPPPPVVVPPPPPVVTPPPPSQSCICRDFRGRCASALFCLGLI